MSRKLGVGGFYIFSTALVWVVYTRRWNRWTDNKGTLKGTNANVELVEST